VIIGRIQGGHWDAAHFVQAVDNIV
jgi:hypothetical protein